VISLPSPPTVIHDEPKIVWQQKMYFGLAITGANMISQIYGSGLLTYYLDVLHMNPTNYSSVFLILSIAHVFFDFYLGFKSDHHSLSLTKGKRIIFLKAAIPIYHAGFILFWIPAISWTQLTLMGFLLIALLLFDISKTAFFLNHSAIQTGMSDDPEQRTSISLYSTFISIPFVSLVAFVPPYVLTSGFSQELIITIFTYIGIFSALIMAIGTYGIRENVSFYKDKRRLTFRKSLQACFSSNSFRFFIVYSFVVSGLGLWNGSCTILFLKNVYGLSGLNIIFPLFLIGAIQIFLFPVFSKMAQKWGVRNSLLSFLVWALFGYLGLFFVENYGWMIFFLGCTQWAAAANGLLINTMIGDIADEDELYTGQRREGAFFGINAILATPAESIMILIFTTIIEMFHYSDAFGSNPNTDLISDAKFGIRLGIGFVPLVFITIGFIALYYFPLKGEKYIKVKRAIHAFHARKKIVE